MTFFKRTQDTLKRARERLQRTPEMLAQQMSLRADIAVTGLRRAGKTVFITSSIHNLLSSAKNRDALRGLGAAEEKRIVGVREVEASAADMPLFPTRSYLQALTAEEPQWPQPTASVTRTELEIRYKRKSFKRHLPTFAEGVLTLGFIDYPGEWLLDLPMVTQSYAQWSKATMELLRSEPRATVTREFLDFVAASDSGQSVDTASEISRKGHALYCDVLRRARDELSLSFLQPGRFIMPDDKGDRPVLWFYPTDVRSGDAPKQGSLDALLAERYDTYCQKIVKPFFAETFGRTNRQVVLVDLLSALNAGRHAFEDTCHALDTALDALQVRRTGLIGQILPRRFDKVLFAVTKADHVPDVQRDRMGDLLEQITGIQSNRARVAGAKELSLQIASICCTVDEKVSLDIGEVDVVVGTPVGQATRVKVYPGTIPKEPPPASFWSDRRIAFPLFKPPPFSALPGRGLPHINLDLALEFLLEDLLQ